MLGILFKISGQLLSQTPDTRTKLSIVMFYDKRCDVPLSIDRMCGTGNRFPISLHHHSNPYRATGLRLTHQGNGNLTKAVAHLKSNAHQRRFEGELLIAY